MTKSFIILPFLLLIINSSFSQINIFFVKHLSDLKLNQEHWQYIHENTQNTDSINFLEAKYYIQYEKDSLFFECFNNSSKLILQDTNLVNYASCYFLKKTNNTRETWFNSIKNKDLSTLSNEIQSIYLLSKNTLENENVILPDEIKKDYKLFQKASKKKPYIALFLSIIPGLGELYIGNKNTFIVKFLPQLILALQSVESVNKIGYFKTATLINISFFSAYYFSGFIGSFRDTKTKQIDTKNQFFINASNYYLINNNISLF